MCARAERETRGVRMAIGIGMAGCVRAPEIDRARLERDLPACLREEADRRGGYGRVAGGVATPIPCVSFIRSRTPAAYLYIYIYVNLLCHRDIYLSIPATNNRFSETTALVSCRSSPDPSPKISQIMQVDR